MIDVMPEKAVAVLLYRLSFPRRLHDMASTFGRSRPALSRIFLWMNARHHDRMYFNLGVVRRQMRGIELRTAVANFFFAVPDGTKVGICRPYPRKEHRCEDLQSQLYNGIMKMHYYAFTSSGHLKDADQLLCLLPAN
ncbi:putative DDE Tnp4 domain-containing protein [Phytophthora infestans]|uniref:Putative DDE Tnp4 domain-containing protein n=1 Tax=Phytophthora infestans TaxID=4787 RepID=A0A833T711_PHYIN|nr:putative DDE Tnp4 domain-containing protein [Phytophthora infestans]